MITQRGWGYDAKIMGIGGDELGALLQAGLYGYSADRAVKHFSKDGRGIIDRADVY